MEPLIVQDDAGGRCNHGEGDGVIFFNFRPDRARQLTRALALANLTSFPYPSPETRLCLLYGLRQTFRLPSPLPQRASKCARGGLGPCGGAQLSLAETEKYAHVTYFSMGYWKEHEFERRLLIPSPKVATYDLEPRCLHLR